MTKIEQFHQCVRDAAIAFERAIDLLDEVDAADLNVLVSREYLLGRLELLADATEAYLPETINAKAQHALEQALG